MTVDSELTLLRTNISDTYTALASKGATLPTVQCANNLKNCVLSLDMNDRANVISAINYTGEALAKGVKVFVTTTNPNTSAQDSGYYIVKFEDIPNDQMYTGVTSAACASLGTVDVFTVLETTVMTYAENDSFIYDVINS